MLTPTRRIRSCLFSCHFLARKTHTFRLACVAVALRRVRTIESTLLCTGCPEVSKPVGPAHQPTGLLVEVNSERIIFVFFGRFFQFFCWIFLFFRDTSIFWGCLTSHHPHEQYQRLESSFSFSRTPQLKNSRPILSLCLLIMGPNTNDDIPSNECLESKNSPEDSQHSIENYFQLNCCANSGTTTAIIWVNFSIFLLKVIKLDLFVSIAVNHFHCYCDRGWFLVVFGQEHPFLWKPDRDH